MNVSTVKRSARLLITSLLLTFSAFSQEYNFRTYTVEDGLGGSQVYAIVQDRDGYLWFGTYGGGISRFDGKVFKNYTVNDGLADNRVLCLFEDSKGKIWIGTYGGGVCRLDPGADGGKAFMVYSTDNGLASNIIHAITEDKKGNIWISAFGKGVQRFDGKEFKLYNQEKNGLLSNDLLSLFCDSKGRLWLGAMNGVSYSEDGKNFRNFSGPDGQSPGQVWTIHEDGSGKMWFGSYGNGASWYNEDQEVPFTRLRVQPQGHNIVYSIAQGPDGDMWFGTDAGGAGIYNGTSYQSITEKNRLCHNRVRTIFRDAEGNIWLGTDGGVSMYPGNSFMMFNTSTGLSDNKILSFLDDGRSVWMGSFGSGVSRIFFSGTNPGEIKELKNFTPADGLGSERVWKIYRDAKGVTWFGTSGGLSEFLGENGKGGKVFRNYSMKGNELPNNMVYALAEDKHGRLWIGSDGGVTIKNGQEFKTYDTDDGLSFNRVRSIVCDREGNMWMGTYSGGVTRYNGNAFETFSGSERLRNAIVYSIAMDSSGILWFGTYGKGIVRYDPYTTDPEKRFDNFDQESGLSNDAVLLLCFDRNGDLWTGTIKGIDKIDMKTYASTGEKKYTHYGKAEGFKGVECNQNAVLCDSRGAMWFGGVNGAAMYLPEKKQHLRPGPRIYIKGIRLFHEATDWKEYAAGMDEQSGLPLNLSLPHYGNHITFDFVGLNFTDPTKTRYRYILEGFDKDLSPVSAENSATYANLPPGNYTFRVLSANGAGSWSTLPASFSFTIQRPYWQSFWFYLTVALLLTSLVLFIYQVRTRKLRKAKSDLERMVQERTEELSEQKEMLEKSNHEKELMLKEIHHRVKNNLQVISSLLNLQSHHITDSATLAVVKQGQVRVRSMALIHQKLYQAGNFSEIDFSEYLVQLSSYIGEMYDDGTSDITCEITTTEKHFDIDTAIPLGLIVTELLSNSYKYAFRDQSEGKITISISRAGDDHFMMRYADNGIGLPSAAVFENSTTLGLELVRMLTEQLSGKLNTYNQDGAVFEIRFRSQAVK